jgi:hypothetical protein
VALWVVEDQGGWKKMCEQKSKEPPSLNSIWAKRARLYLEEKFPDTRKKKDNIHDGNALSA